MKYLWELKCLDKAVFLHNATVLGGWWQLKYWCAGCCCACRGVSSFQVADSWLCVFNHSFYSSEIFNERVEFALSPLRVCMNVVADSFLCSAEQSRFIGDNIEGYSAFLVRVMSTETALSF